MHCCLFCNFPSRDARPVNLCPAYFWMHFKRGDFNMKYLFFFCLKFVSKLPCCHVCIKIALLPGLYQNCLVARLHLPPLRGTPRNDRTSAGSLRERRIAAAFSSPHYLNESPMNCCLDLASLEGKSEKTRQSPSNENFD